MANLHIGSLAVHTTKLIEAFEALLNDDQKRVLELKTIATEKFKLNLDPEEIADDDVRGWYKLFNNLVTALM